MRVLFTSWAWRSHYFPSVPLGWAFSAAGHEVRMASQPDDLAALHARHGPFDIIIDDGSHIGEHIHTSFNTLFPYLRDGGVYVIEDLQTAYLTEFGGSPGETAGPDTSVGLTKRLLDDQHHQEHQHVPDRHPSVIQRTITGLHIYHNIVFVEKGTNAEEGFPGWLLEVVAGDLH